MRACIDDETAALVIGGALSDEALAEIDAHVDACPECLALLAALVHTVTSPLDRDVDVDALPSALKPGDVVGRYVLRERIGSGGMGTVYAAEDPALGRTVALKLVRASLRSERSNRNLLTEARMMAQLSHRNVVPVFDAGNHDDFVFLTMELIDGQNVREWLDAEKRPWREVLRVFLDAGRGLAAAHDVGLVHRDFKPDNVLVDKDGRAVVTDFGLAHSSRVEVDLVGGTPGYMAPEQAAGQAPDARADQYSFSVALHEALRGKRAPAFLERILARGMSTDPGERFPSMNALLGALSRDPHARWRRLAIAGGVLATIGATVFATYRISRQREHACAESVAPRLAGVWDQDRKRAVHEAFRATKKASAESAWVAVEQTIDAYTAQWTAMHVEACDATFVSHAQSADLYDLRAACLGERLAEVRATISFLAVVDERGVDGAAAAARSLTPIASCGDARALRAIAPPAPAVAARVADLRRELARAKAMRDAGKFAEARVLLERVAEDTKGTGYGPVEASALLQLGDAELAGGDAVRADTTLGRAALLADTARDDVTRARALTRQLYAVGHTLQQFDRAAALDAQTRSVIERLGGDDELESDRLQTVGMISLAQHQLPAAYDQLTRAVELREKVFGPRGRRVAMSRHSRCLVLVEQKKLDAALAECNLALDIWKESVGATHPDVSLGLKEVGRILILLGRRDEGCHTMEEALAIEEASLEHDHPTIATTLLGLADCREGAWALELEKRALAIREKKLGPNHPRTVEARARVEAHKGP